MAFGDPAVNLNIYGDMVRGNFGHGGGKSIWELASPISTGENPIKLLQKRSILHITPGELPAFQWDLN